MLVGLAVAVQLVANAGANAGGEGGRAALFGPVWIVNGAGLTGAFWVDKGADPESVLFVLYFIIPVTFSAVIQYGMICRSSKLTGRSAAW